MDRWLSQVTAHPYARTEARRRVFDWCGRISAGLVAALVFPGGGIRRNRYAHYAQGKVPVSSATPLFLPAGKKALLPAGCGTCSGQAEYVCSNCCADGVCCPDGNLYREPCFDQNCNLYYEYWCA